MDIDELECDVDDDIDEWEYLYQISYASGKPSPMKTTRKNAMPYWQKIEQLKDQSVLHKQLTRDEFCDYE